MEMYPQCIPRNSSNSVGLCSVVRRCTARRSSPEHIEISTKPSNTKGPGNCLPGPIFGADNGIRVFEPLAITGVQPVEKISTHSFHQKSHSFATFARSQCKCSSSFSSILGESKFDSRAFLQLPALDVVICIANRCTIAYNRIAIQIM